MNIPLVLSENFTVVDLVNSLCWDDELEMYRFQVGEGIKIDFENNYAILKELFSRNSGEHVGKFNALHFENIAPEVKWINVSLESGPEKLYIENDTARVEVVYKISNPENDEDCFYLRFSGHESSCVGYSLDKIEVVKPYVVKVKKFKKISD